MKTSPLFNSLQLPNGTTLRNRIAKAAMEESMADQEQVPGKHLWQLYERWAIGGAGLIITGNVMIDRRALTGPAAVVLDDGAHLEKFRVWADRAKSGGAQVWMQINHPGRQMYAFLGQEVLAPSAIAVNIPGLASMFSLPREMTPGDIQRVIEQHVTTALLAERAGFDGVEVHAAHGYLLSQFLSPITNKRTDEWGGSLETRARLLVTIIQKIRAVVRPGFCVAVKLNSADFQRGGFEEADAIEVVKLLNELAIDLIEISGGSYESPAMQGQTSDGRTLAREAYFLSFAEEVARISYVPIMVTGGIRRKPVAEGVLRKGVSVVGMATALALQPSTPNDWLAGRNTVAEPLTVMWKNKTLAAAATNSIVKLQLSRLSRGKSPKQKVSPLLVFIGNQVATRLRARQYRRWVQTV